MTELSRAQREIFDAIQALSILRGFPPTIRDLCGFTGRSSTNAIAEVLVRLEKKGFIAREPNSARAIKILKGDLYSGKKR